MDRDDARLELLIRLKELDYRFVSVTPATHERVIARGIPTPPSLRDVFGWSRPFQDNQIDRCILELMARAEMLQPCAEGMRSALRVAAMGEDLFLHSAFPTEGEDAVFFGPDTYRFARFIEQHLAGLPRARAVDFGAGTGAGGIFLARLAPEAAVTLLDSNAAALDLARVNARAARVEAELVLGSELAGSPDLVIANPPYMMDEADRAYRDGGNLLGGEVALEWTKDALAKLAPGGAMLLYTGAAFADGASPLLSALERTCREAGAVLFVEEMDPDVFGEELSKPPYHCVERIAAIGAIIRTPA